MQLLIDVPQGLQERIIPLAHETNETTEELALRLLQEYVDDCEDAERISAEVASGKMPTYSWEEVKAHLDLDN